VIVVRSGDLIPFKAFLFRSWVPIDILADFGEDAVVSCFAYPEQVVDPDARIELVVEQDTANSVKVYAATGDDPTPLAPGKYGFIVKVSDKDDESREYFPAVGSHLLIVGEAP
jgi:hypothetical protein